LGRERRRDDDEGEEIPGPLVTGRNPVPGPICNALEALPCPLQFQPG